MSRYQTRDEYGHKICDECGTPWPCPIVLTEDSEALRRSHNDLSDICPCKHAEYERGMAEVYQRAEQIRIGLRNPLSS